MERDGYFVFICMTYTSSIIISAMCYYRCSTVIEYGPSKRVYCVFPTCDRTFCITF